MIRGGQVPKPTALKLIQGNPGKRALNDAEPVPTGEVKKPVFVKGRAARLWAKYAPGLEDQGVLTAWDCEMFALWCCLMSDFQQDPKSFTAGQIGQLRGLAAAFGLVPSERARLKAGPKKKSEDPAEKYFG